MRGNDCELDEMNVRSNFWLASPRADTNAEVNTSRMEVVGRKGQDQASRLAQVADLEAGNQLVLKGSDASCRVPEGLDR